MNMVGTAFASDFDGTLCASDWETGEESYRDEDLEAIQKYREAGGLFGICTGRPLMAVIESLEGLLELDFYIVSTGAQVLDHDRNLLWERTISRDVAQAIFDRHASPNSVLLADTEQDFASVRDEMGRGLRVAPSLDEVRGKLLGVSVECRGDEDAARAVCADINERFAGEVAAFQNLGSVDIVPAGCSKGEGMRIVRRALGIEAMAGAGDSYNDLPLLSAADVAYTFVSSPAVVRNAADVVVNTLEEAVLHFLRQPSCEQTQIK